MTDVSNLDELANAIASSSSKIKAYAKAQAAATQSQEGDIQTALITPEPEPSGADAIPILYVTDFGTLELGFSSTADNAPIIQAALNAAAAHELGFGANRYGAIVQLPAGPIPCKSGLTVGGSVWLRGAGPGLTELLWRNNFAGVGLTLDNTNSQAKCSDFSVADISGTMTGGINVKNGIAAFQQFGGINTELERVFVVGGGAGYGIQLAGVENRLRDCYVAHSGQEGIKVIGSDMFLSNCTVDTCGSAGQYGGYLLATSNTKLSNCKAFGCTGSGFNIGSGQRNMLSSCESQDNGLYGFNDGGDNVYAACVADSNGKAGGTMYGFSLIGASCATGCFAINRLGPTQTYGYRGGVNNGARPTVFGTSRLAGVADVDPNGRGYFVVNGVVSDLA